MKRRLRFGMLAVLLLVVGGWALAMLIPWSRPCEEQRAEAAAAWRRVAEAGPASQRADALAIAEAVSSDVTAALELADQLAPPREAREMYRDAMERLALAQSACFP